MVLSSYHVGHLSKHVLQPHDDCVIPNLNISLVVHSYTTTSLKSHLHVLQIKFTSAAAMMIILSLLSFIAFPSTTGQFFGIETGFNNTCLWEKEGLNRVGPREFDCPRFVIESTDQIWNMYRG